MVQQTAEIQQLKNASSAADATVQARLAGYSTAIADFRFYVLEGNAPPPENFR